MTLLTLNVDILLKDINLFIEGLISVLTTSQPVLFLPWNRWSPIYSTLPW